MTARRDARHWNDRYASGNKPWDSGIPSRELLDTLDEAGIGACRVLEIGCGTGTTAIELARRGFDVVAIDCSTLAIEQARSKADAAGVSVDWYCSDFTTFVPAEPFPLLFDRGCYHCVRQDNLPGLLEAIGRCTSVGSRFVLLTGNASERRDHGPPGVTAAQLRQELGGLFQIERIREFHFEDAGGVQGPLGWSVLLTRR